MVTVFVSSSTEDPELEHAAHHRGHAFSSLQDAYVARHTTIRLQFRYDGRS